MKRTNKCSYLIIAFSCLIAFRLWAAEAQNFSTSPAFDDFPAHVVAPHRQYASRVILETPRSKRYRTIISLEARKEPNFAGHYRVVTWGCGTDCHGFAIVDRITGVAYTDPVIKYVSGAMGNNEPRIDFRPDSRLLILNGLINDDLEGKFFYRWTGKELKLIYRAPLVKDDLLDGATEGN